MARPPARCKQDDLARAWRAADAVGKKLQRTEIKPDGTIVLVHDEVQQPQPTPEPTPPHEIEL
jgi:hypothetical protein